jgi:hypothetical protein
MSMKLPIGTRVRTPYNRTGIVTGRSVYGTAVVHYDDDALANGGVEWPDERLTVIGECDANPQTHRIV